MLEFQVRHCVVVQVQFWQLSTKQSMTASKHFIRLILNLNFSGFKMRQYSNKNIFHIFNFFGINPWFYLGMFELSFAKKEPFLQSLFNHDGIWYDCIDLVTKCNSSKLSLRNFPHKKVHITIKHPVLAVC